MINRSICDYLGFTMKAMKTKPTSPEYKAFENLLGKVLIVTKVELNQRLKEEKQGKNPPEPAIQNDKPAHC
jgi:hypothetical protein